MLKQLKLQNFRNYETLELDFSGAGLTYLVGDNGQGKTNVLEAIYLLALGKSFRGGTADLVKWEQDFARVRGVFDEVSLEAFFGIPPQPQRVFKRDEVKVGAAAFVGSARIVFFHPEDINMLYLGPELRRRYLDIMNIQISSEYFRALRDFKRIKEQRNALLRDKREQELGLWDEQLAAAAATIYVARAKTLDFINRRLKEVYCKIAGVNQNLEVHYHNSLGIDFSMLMEAEGLEQLILEEMDRARPRDLQSGHTSVGPHRDDFAVLLDGIEIARHASRGEYRSIVLALKLIELEFFEGSAILLLDDVFSELDHSRQVFLLEEVQKHQTIITTTKDSAVINREKLLDGHFVEISDGAITKT